MVDDRQISDVLEIHLKTEGGRGGFHLIIVILGAKETLEIGF